MDSSADAIYVYHETRYAMIGRNVPRQGYGGRRANVIGTSRRPYPRDLIGKPVFGRMVSKPIMNAMNPLNCALRVVYLMGLAAVLCSVASVRAQNSEITPETNVEPALLHTWLKSGDPRLVAWAADFARRHHDAALVSEIPGVIVRWRAAPIDGDYPKRIAPRRTILALVDALIQEHTEVSIELIQSLANEFPAQSMLLIERLPLERSSPTLMNWAFSNDFHAPITGTRAHAAAMILAHNPDPNFAYHIVEGLVQHVTVHVSRQWMGFAGSGGMSCGDSFAVSPPPRWPIVYDYRLLERNSEVESRSAGLVPIVTLGDRTVDAERFEETGGRGGCWSHDSDASFRHELLAYLLGVKPDKMPWQPEESINVVWTTKSAYERELGSIVETERGKMLGTLQQLKNRNLFDERMPTEPSREYRLALTAKFVRVPCRIHRRSGSELHEKSSFREAGSSSCGRMTGYGEVESKNLLVSRFIN
jgi:hypothetical protein